MIRRNAGPVVAMATALLTGAAYADEGYFDMATVVTAEPVVVTRTATDPACHDDARRQNERNRLRFGLGDVRAHNTGLELGTVLRAAVAAPPVAQCPPVTERRVVGYDVTLRYGAEQWTMRMQRDPGERVRVRVRLDPPSAAQARAGR